MKNLHRITRRKFLTRSATMAGAGLALPYLIPRNALADGDRPGANERLAIGYIAAGRRAGQLPLPKAGQAIAYCDVDRTRADEAAAKDKCAAMYDYQKLLDRKDIDGVIISSPDHWHALHMIRACQAGKHVYIEKPISFSIEHGRLMVEAARKYNRVVQAGSHQRSMPANVHGCELVRSGIIGKVHKVIGHNYPSPWECRFPAQPMRKGLDWDAWCGPGELVPFHMDVFIQRSKPGWMSMTAFSGGEMCGWGAHGLDQIQSALGMDHSGPTEIWVEGPKFDPPVYTAPESAA
ncbi:MAG: Gfo/Idh/MocA family protein, partial [Thermoguttaceae bacterium]